MPIGNHPPATPEKLAELRDYLNLLIYKNREAGNIGYAEAAEKYRDEFDDIRDAFVKLMDEWPLGQRKQ